jgi:hypothetical protein
MYMTKMRILSGKLLVATCLSTPLEGFEFCKHHIAVLEIVKEEFEGTPLKPRFTREYNRQRYDYIQAWLHSPLKIQRNP